MPLQKKDKNFSRMWKEKIQLKGGSIFAVVLCSIYKLRDGNNIDHSTMQRGGSIE